MKSWRKSLHVMNVVDLAMPISRCERRRLCYLFPATSMLVSHNDTGLSSMPLAPFNMSERET